EVKFDDGQWAHRLERPSFHRMRTRVAAQTQPRLRGLLALAIGIGGLEEIDHDGHWEPRRKLRRDGTHSVCETRFPARGWRGHAAIDAVDDRHQMKAHSR